MSGVDFKKIKEAIEKHEAGQMTAGAVLSQIMKETNKFKVRNHTRLSTRPLEVRMGCARAVAGSKSTKKKKED